MVSREAKISRRLPFGERLRRSIAERRSSVVLGLDPRPELFPPEFLPRRPDVRRDAARALARSTADFHAALVEETAPYLVGLKPQSAFYERWGEAGLRCLERTCRLAEPRGLLLILDVKRGDVPETARAYAQAYLSGSQTRGSRIDPFPSDAITVNPYLGLDALEPFFEAALETGKGVFVLLKTSNPGSGDFQDLSIGGSPLYVRIARRILRWSRGRQNGAGTSSIGFVVGATHPSALGRVREIAPRAPLLIPGYGAQGGRAEDLRSVFEPPGAVALVNSSRGIAYAYHAEPWSRRYGPKLWRKAVRAAAAEMREELERVRSGL